MILRISLERQVYLTRRINATCCNYWILSSRPTGFEPVTYGLEEQIQAQIQLIAIIKESQNQLKTLPKITVQPVQYVQYKHVCAMCG